MFGIWTAELIYMAFIIIIILLIILLIIGIIWYLVSRKSKN